MNGFDKEVLAAMQLQKEQLWDVFEENSDLPEIPKSQEKDINSLYDSVDKILKMIPQYSITRINEFEWNVRRKDKRVPEPHLKSAKLQKKRKARNELLFETRQTEIKCTGYLRRKGAGKNKKYCTNKLLELKLLPSVPDPDLRTTSQKRSSSQKDIPEEIVCDECSATIAYGKLNGEVTTIFCCIGLHTPSNPDDEVESVERLDYCYVCVVAAARKQNKLTTSIFHTFFILFSYIFHTFFIHFSFFFHTFFILFSYFFHTFFILFSYIFHSFFIHFLYFFHTFFIPFSYIFQIFFRYYS